VPDVDQPTVAGSRLLRLLSRSLLVLCGAVAGTVLAWLVSAGAASASQRDLPLGPSPLPVPVAAVADVAGLDVTTTDMAGEDIGDTAGEDVAGTSRGDIRPLSEIVVHHVKTAPHVEQVKQVVLVEKVQHLTRDTAEELLKRAPSVMLPPTSLLADRSPQAGRVADSNGTEPLVLPKSFVDQAGADQRGDPDGQCRSYRCAPVGYPTASPHEVSGQRRGAGPSPELSPNDHAPRRSVGLDHFPLGPAALPGSCSCGQGYGHPSSGFAEQSSVVTARATAASAPRPTTQWAPLVRGDQPCTTPD
jgi:hypothetical protein